MRQGQGRGGGTSMGGRARGSHGYRDRGRDSHRHGARVKRQIRGRKAGIAEASALLWRFDFASITGPCLPCLFLSPRRVLGLKNVQRMPPTRGLSVGPAAGGQGVCPEGKGRTQASHPRGTQSPLDRDVLEERRRGGGVDGGGVFLLWSPIAAPKAPENFFKAESSCAKGTEEKFCLKQWKGRRGWGLGGGRGVQRGGGGGAPPTVVSRSNTFLPLDTPKEPRACTGLHLLDALRGPQAAGLSAISGLVLRALRCSSFALSGRSPLKNRADGVFKMHTDRGPRRGMFGAPQQNHCCRCEMRYRWAGVGGICSRSAKGSHGRKDRGGGTHGRRHGGRGSHRHRGRAGVCLKGRALWGPTQSNYKPVGAH